MKLAGVDLASFALSALKLWARGGRISSMVERASKVHWTVSRSFEFCANFSRIDFVSEIDSVLLMRALPPAPTCLRPGLGSSMSGNFGSGITTLGGVSSLMARPSASDNLLAKPPAKAASN